MHLCYSNRFVRVSSRCDVLIIVIVNIIFTFNPGRSECKDIILELCALGMIYGKLIGRIPMLDSAKDDIRDLCGELRQQLLFANCKG